MRKRFQESDKDLLGQDLVEILQQQLRSDHGGNPEGDQHRSHESVQVQIPAANLGHPDGRMDKLEAMAREKKIVLIARVGRGAAAAADPKEMMFQQVEDTWGTITMLKVK